MFIIGEKINATRKSIDAAIKAKDAAYIQQVAVEQSESGAHWLDVNCGTLAEADEPEAMQWLVAAIQEVTEVPLCIDSPNAKALEAGLKAHRGGNPLINSISAESKRYGDVLPLVKQYDAGVIALCNDDSGLPSTKEEALKIGDGLINQLIKDGIDVGKIYLDPLVRTLATNAEAVTTTLEVIHELASRFPGLHFVSGLSNVSYGLPERRHLNRAFVVMSIAYGLDSVIIDPTDKNIIALIYAAEALANKDAYCMNYIRAYNDGKLKI